MRGALRRNLNIVRPRHRSLTTAPPSERRRGINYATLPENAAAVRNREYA